MVTFLILLILAIIIFAVVITALGLAAGALSAVIVVFGDIALGVFLFSLIFRLFRKKK